MNVGRYLRGEDRHVGTARTTQFQQPQRTWVGLTEEEILSISADCAATHQHTDIHFARAIEAALKAKNT
jgi:hypothetical protein